MDEFLNWMGTPAWTVSPAVMLAWGTGFHLLWNKLSSR